MNTRQTTAHESFLRSVGERGHDVRQDPVIAREGVYVLDGTGHLLVRTSVFHRGRRHYFFGLTKHTFENFSQLPHSVVALVFSDTGRSLLVPASWLWERRNRLSQDTKQYKLTITEDFKLRLFRSGGVSLDLTPFADRFDLLGGVAQPGRAVALPPAHADIQGMLIEIGNLRGLQTYCPNKSPSFRGKRLGQMASVADLPVFSSLNSSIIRQIDVIWLENSFPVHAFEVELSTGIWPGLVRLAELRRLRTTLHVITKGDDGAFRRRVAGDIFREILDRCHHASEKQVKELYEMETRMARIKRELAL